MRSDSYLVFQVFGVNAFCGSAEVRSYNIIVMLLVDTGQRLNSSFYKYVRYCYLNIKNPRHISNC